MADLSGYGSDRTLVSAQAIQPFPLLVLSALLLAVALVVPSGLPMVGALGAGAGLVAAAILMSGLAVRDWVFRHTKQRRIESDVLNDTAPAVLTTVDGTILVLNESARLSFRPIKQETRTLADLFSASMAEPTGLLTRLVKTAQEQLHGYEDIETPSASIRIRVQKKRGALLMWRIELFEHKLRNQSKPTSTVALDQNSCSEINETTQTNDTRLEAAEPLLDGLPVPILKIDVDGQVGYANTPAKKLLNFPESDPPPLYDLVEGMGRPIAEWLSDAAQGRGLVKTEFVRATRADRELFIQISLGRIEENGHTRLLGILNDATELKTLEAQFVQSQKMQAIGQLAGGVAHDFNNLLTAISGHCDLLLLRHDEGDPDFTDLMQIAQNANRAASLVGQLLAFSRKQNLKPQALDLRDTMSDLTHLLNRLVGEKISLDLRIAPAETTIRADRRQFEQVIMNLVVNARDAMPSGGEIEILVEPRELQEPLQRDRADIAAGDYVVIRVRDTGSGIPADQLPKIFEPFFTTKKTGEGTGLGLSTAYGIVKQTGGYIFVDSELGKGSVFTLYFPLHTQSETSTEHVAPETPKSSTSAGEGVVLLVEDEAPVRAFASRALRLRGYTVIEAENAEMALDILSDDALEIDVFVTDVIMPGMDGPTWVKKALEHRPDTRIIFVSGYAEESLAENQMRVPNSVFLPKPFSLNQLTNVVHEQLH